MFTPNHYQTLTQEISQSLLRDRHILEELRQEVRPLKQQVYRINERNS